jgi:hypothetical protein
LSDGIEGKGTARGRSPARDRQIRSRLEERSRFLGRPFGACRRSCAGIAQRSVRATDRASTRRGPPHKEAPMIGSMVLMTVVTFVWCVHQGRVALGLSDHWVRGRYGRVFEILLPAPWDRIVGASCNVLAGILCWAVLMWINFVR